MGVFGVFQHLDLERKFGVLKGQTATDCLASERNHPLTAVLVWLTDCDQFHIAMGFGVSAGLSLHKPHEAFARKHVCHQLSDQQESDSCVGEMNPDLFPAKLKPVDVRRH